MVRANILMIVVVMVIIKTTSTDLRRSRSVERTFLKNIAVPRRNLSTLTSSVSVPIPLFLLHLLKHKLKYQKIDKVTTTTTTKEPLSDCICVPYYMCDSNNTIITDGMGLIDIRYRPCTGDLEVCCRLPDTTAPSPQPIPTSLPIGNFSTQPVFPSPIVMSSTMSSMVPPTMPSKVPPTMPSMVSSTMPSMVSSTRPSMMPPTMPSTTSSTMFPITIVPTMPSISSSRMPTAMPPTINPTISSSSPLTMLPATTSSSMTFSTASTIPFSISSTLYPTTSPTNCVCVPSWQCNNNGIIIVSGQGVIDPRQQFGFCSIPGQVCCKLSATSVNFPTSSPVIAPSSPSSSITTTTQGQLQVCICVKTWQCDTNGFIIVSGAGIIDPRFPIGRYGQVGDTCVATNEICCRVPPTGQDSSMIFPTDATSPNMSPWGPVKYPGTAQACVCVKSWRCSDDNVVSQDGDGIIDPRFGVCSVANEICCLLRAMINVPMSSVTTKAQVTLTGGHGTPVLENCGIRKSNLENSRSRNSGDTYFAEFPWMVALLVRQTNGSALFQCGASLLNTRAILTAAHCVIGPNSRNTNALLVRVGEWDTKNNNEPVSFQESNVQTIVSHPQFYSGGLYHDVAVIILATPITYAVNAIPICLPRQSMSFPPGTKCYATGWGRNAFDTNGQYQAVLRQIDLPIVEQSECQSRLRETRLGQYFQLHGSFICAGGEPNKDTCRGDGGGPLVCPSSTGQFIQAGIVSWGIGCGASNIPAVYASVSQHRQWIDQQLANYGVL